MNGKVYLVTNTVNGKQYVGQTWQSLEKRWAEHCLVARSKTHPFSRSILKYGADVFEVEILYEGVTDQSELDELEKLVIKEYETLVPNGYNLQEGGRGGRHSELSKNKVAEYRRGRKHSDDTKQKISESMKGEKNPNFGKRGAKRPDVSERNRMRRGVKYKRRYSKDQLLLFE